MKDPVITAARPLPGTQPHRTRRTFRPGPGPMARALAIGLALAWSSAAWGAITIPGADGSDGALHITEDTVIDLSQAVTGVWDQDNTANAGNGIYDPEKWAVVFKYRQVTVDAGATLTFSNHPSRAPVVWLVSGDLAIDGTVSLNGENWRHAPALAEPGPGGFRGGTGTYAGHTGSSGSGGFGVGGAPGGGITVVQAPGGSYGSRGDNKDTVVSPALVYGNPSLIPLIGGSGGGGSGNYTTHGGGGGGGAILIACGGIISINGVLRANGGNGTSPGNLRSGSGSGGGIRLVCDTLTGDGILNALGGTGGNLGGLGRIRIERVISSFTNDPTPAPSVVNLAAGTSALIWPPADAPAVRVISIRETSVPPDPRAEFGTIGADVALAESDLTHILIETTNVEQASTVIIRLTPRMTFLTTETQAAVSNVVSTEPLVIHWTANLPVRVGYSAVQVKVSRP